MTGLIPEKEFSRKSFLKGGGALVVGFSLIGAGLTSKAGAAIAPTPAGYLPDPMQVDSFLSVHADNSVGFKTSQIEAGNGATTGLAMIVAEELGVSAAQVRHVGMDSLQVVYSGTTAGSWAISTDAGPRLRAAAATAREVLLGLAATSLGVPAASLTVDKGIVSGGGKAVTYGQLLGERLFNTTVVGVPPPPAYLNVTAFAMTLNPGVAPAKPMGQYTIIGTKVPRIDIPAKVTGAYTYVHSIRIPGMLHGRVVRPRGQGAYGTGIPIVAVDEGSIKHIPDVQILRKGNFLAVVAPREWDAIQAAAELKVTWNESSLLPGSGNTFKQMREHDSAGLANAVLRTNTGNVDTALNSTAHSVSQTFKYPYQGRAVIGPSCAVADVRANSAVIYCSSQSLLGVPPAVSQITGIPAGNVRVLYYEGASSFGGGQSSTESSKAAALMSMLAGAPVRTQLMRWDEMGWDNFSSAHLMDVRGGIDANGKLVAWDFTLMAQPYTSFDPTSELIGSPYPPGPRGAWIDDPSVGDAYASTNKRLTGKTLNVFKGYLRDGAVRSGGNSMQSAFATEQVIDQLAHAAKMDPVAFRRANVSDDFWLTALNAAASAANWQPRITASNLSKANVVTGRGVAIAAHVEAARAGVVVDVEVNKKTGKITVTHIYLGLDAGLVINPDLVANQMVGGAIWGTSHALLEGITTTKTNVTSLDFLTYPILRFKDAPTVTTVIASRPNELPKGCGESPCTPVPAAIANAFFDATGVRMYEAPLSPARVRAALSAAGAT
jgi:CO/xanthine dehydrogenase Mo-binding subunit